MHMENKDKVAIITGSSAGLGASVAIGLAKKGVNIVINYSKSKELHMLMNSFEVTIFENCKNPYAILRFCCVTRMELFRKHVGVRQKLLPHGSR